MHTALFGFGWDSRNPFERDVLQHLWPTFLSRILATLPAKGLWTSLTMDKRSETLANQTIAAQILEPKLR